MNLSQDVLRWLAVRAIRGRTWAGDRVFDSPSSPADIRTETEREPFISVYVDDSDWEMTESQSLLTAYPGVCHLVIEVGVASPHNLTAEEAEDREVGEAGETVTQLNATDEGLEAQIGLISRQAISALLSTQPTNPWAELFRMLTAGKLQGMKIRRGGPPGDAQRPKPRYASRVMIISTGVLAEPARGEDINRFPFWKAFFAATRDDPEMGGLATLVLAHIVTPSGKAPDWRLAQKYLHLPEDAARALGIAPVDGWDETTPLEEPVAPISDITYGPNGEDVHPLTMGYEYGTLIPPDASEGSHDDE